MEPTHHYLWIFFAFCVLAVVTYIVTINRPDNYAKGSIHAEMHEQNWPLSISIGKGGCARLNPDMLKPVNPKVKK